MIFNKNSTPTQTEVTPVAPAKVVTTSPVYNADSPFGVVSSYIFGLEFNQPGTIIQAGAKSIETRLEREERILQGY